MFASSSVSTVFKCMSCSFGTCDQTSYAEHIKHCGSESVTEAEPVIAESEQLLTNPMRSLKRGQTYVCKECLLPTGCPRALLIHMRDEHGKDAPIFICKCCSRYASYTYNLVYKHARRKHPEKISRGKVYCKLLEKGVVREGGAESEAVTDAVCAASESGAAAEQQATCLVKSSTSLGLQFLQKQLPGIGRDGFACQLCGFSHIASHLVVKHIWKDHEDKCNEAATEATSMHGVVDATVTSILYKCDDCDYSTRARLRFYNHCSHHQFNGPSKCPHCSYCAMGETGIITHVHKYHASQQSDKLDSTTHSCQSKAPDLRKVRKRSGSSRYRKLSAHERPKRKWYTCPHCTFKSVWSASVSHHKRAVHAELHKGYRPRPAVDSNIISRKQSQRVPSASCNVPDTVTLDASSTTSEAKRFQCDLCSKTFSSRQQLYKHKLVHTDLRRYKCSVCGLRSNHSANIYKHVNAKHKGEKAQLIVLSVEDARKTIETYRQHPVKLPHRSRKRSDSTGTCNNQLHSPADAKAPAIQGKTSVVNIRSTEDHVIRSKRPKFVKKSNTATLHLSIVKRRKPRKLRQCSACKMQSYHLSSMLRHIRHKHGSKNAKMIFVSEKNSVQKSRKLACERLVPVRTPKAVAYKLVSQSGEKSCQQRVDNAEHDNSGEEFRRENRACEVQPNVENKSPLRATGDSDVHTFVPLRLINPNPSARFKYVYTCDVCPYTANTATKVIAHHRLHVKRAGYNFECTKCLYFACQYLHLERHMLLHKTQDTQSSIDTDRTSQASVMHLCERCPYMSVRRSSLIYHRQLHRRRTSAQYKCQHCAFWISDTRALISHERVHSAEYMQRRTEYSQLSKTSDSRVSSVVGMASQKHRGISSDMATCTGVNELEELQCKSTVTTYCEKLDEWTQNKSVNDGDETVVGDDSAVAAAKGGADILESVPSQPAAASRHLPSWCCERCPYSAKKLPCFKRHVWLHGKQYIYECRYCDYSVQSYWQLVSHVLWHFEPNKHLLYAQSVSNLDSFPSLLPNRDGVPESLASFDKFVPTFENSDVFLLSDVANFQCNYCPYVTERRSEFFSHMKQHYVHTAHSCPFCNFHADLPENLTAHIFLHFNLPGCRQSFIPPNVCPSEKRKLLEASIESVVKKRKPEYEVHSAGTNYAKPSCGQAEINAQCVLSLMDTDNLSCNTDETKQVGISDDVSENRSILSVVCKKEENAATVPFMAQTLDFNLKAVDQGLPDAHHAALACPSMSVKSSHLEERRIMTPEPNYKTELCQCCDKRIDDPEELAVHVAGHFIGFDQSVFS